MDNHRTKYLLLLFLILLMSLPLRAQHISGYVIDDATGDSIPYASVVYKGHKVAVVSNLGGRYTVAIETGHKKAERGDGEDEAQALQPEGQSGGGADEEGDRKEETDGS